jgi:limonene 1,2-monooxygenase
VDAVTGGATAAAAAGSSVIGTPDDLVEFIRHMYDITGGFGVVIGFVHDWANPEATRRSWDMVARYVVPEVNGYLASMRDSQTWVIEHRQPFERATQAILNKVNENARAAEALGITLARRQAEMEAASPD